MFSILLLGLEFLYVSVVIIILYRLKPKFGLTLLFIFIGSNQYFQTILTTFNIHIGFLSFSPGSVIIFSSSIFAVLLVYLKDGVKSARTLIYGIVIANFSIKILSMVTYGQFENMSFHIQNFAISPELFRVNFRTYYVGIAALIIDSYLLIIFYDFLKYKVKYKSLFGRIFFSLLIALVIDSVLFTTGSFFELPNYSNILLSQLFSKSIAATMFSAILYIYFQFFDKEWTAKDSATINTKFDVFSILTYRDKYKELKIESEQKLKQQLAEITSLNTIFKNISSNIAIDKLVTAIIEELNINLQPDLILFYKRNNSDLDILEIKVNDSLRKFDQSNQHKVGTCLCGLAVKTKTPQYSANINVDSRCTLSECKNAGFKSFAALPLLNKNEVIGVIGIASSAERNFKLKSYFLEAIAAEAAIALSNSMLYSELQNQKKELLFEVSEKKSALDNLRESESKYRTIVDNSHSGIGIIDNNFTILYANERLADIFGSSQEEIVGEKIDNFLTDESKSLVLSRYKKRQSGEILPTSYEYTIKRKDGSIREIKGSASVIQTSSGKKNTIAQLLDITEEKLANNKLIASENKFRSVVEHAPDAMYLFDFEGNIIDFNKKAMEKLGYTSEELHNLKMNDISQDFFEKNETADIIKKMKPNKPIWIERNHIKKDGTIFPVEISAGLVEIDERTLILGFARDVTEKEKDKEKLRKYRYKLEELVKQRTIQLEEANKELESFSYSVSHDLRAPLRHINGFIELLSIDSSAKLGPKSMHYLETISHASDQMGNLIDELLDFSRMGRSSMSFTEIDFGDLIHDVKNELLRDNIVAKRNIEWEITKMPMTYGDITMLRTVIVNLLSNAIKYTSKKEKSFIKISCNCENAKEFIFCVTDNGAGFDSRFADKLFGVFQRLHSKQEFEGTGIGLANVRRIISRHRGKTWAESEVDKGAKFYFSLPKKNNITSN